MTGKLSREEVVAWENRTLSVEEFQARSTTPMSDHEREDFEGLVRWFTRRYPTAGDRMRAIRHRMQQLRARYP